MREKADQSAGSVKPSNYRAFFNLAPIGYFILDECGLIRQMNPSAAVLLGRARNSILQQRFDQFVALEDRTLFDAFWSRLQESRNRQTCEIQLLTAGEGLCHVRIDAAVAEVFPGRQQGSLLAVIDIAARKQSEMQLRISEARYRSLVETQADIITRSDLEGRLTYVNDAYCRMFGVDRKEVLNRPFFPTVIPEDLPISLAALEAVRVVPYRLATETRHPTPHGLRWIQWENSAVVDEAGGVFELQGIGRDITDRKEAEKELLKTRLQLWQADRVAQTSVITSSLAHELNQPLTAILSNAQAGLRFMARENPDLEEIREILNEIVRDDQRAAGIINGLRAMLRRREARRERINLGETIQGIIMLLHSELRGRKIECRLRLEPDCLVVADKGQIQQVILDLVMNAVDVMQDQPAETRQLELALTCAETDEALVSVQDSGPGVSDDDGGRLFETFWSTKKQGLGVGLPVSRSIIESHGGRLWFENNPDQGATFYVMLPRLAGE